MDPFQTNSGFNGSNSTYDNDIELEALKEPFQTILAIIYTITAILAFIGNTTAVTILLTRKRSSPELRKYLINLFTADILIALFAIPFSYTDFMFGEWVFPKILCPLTNFMSVCAVCVSIYTLIAIGIERYFAIVYPFEPLMFFERHTKSVIAIIWMIGISLGSPQLIQSRALEFVYRNEKLFDCRELWEQEFGGKVYTTVIFILTFAIPFVVLTFLYTSIGLTTFRQTVPGNDNSNRNQVQHQNRIKMVKMLVVLVIAFLICWLPIQLFNTIMWLCDNCRALHTKFQVDIYVATYFLCHFLSMAHALIDPIIYCFLSHNFKFVEICSYFYSHCSKDERKYRNRENITLNSCTLSTGCGNGKTTLV